MFNLLITTGNPRLQDTLINFWSIVGCLDVSGGAHIEFKAEPNIFAVKSTIGITRS